MGPDDLALCVACGWQCVDSNSCLSCGPLFESRCLSNQTLSQALALRTRENPTSRLTLHKDSKTSIPLYRYHLRPYHWRFLCSFPSQRNKNGDSNHPDLDILQVIVTKTINTTAMAILLEAALAFLDIPFWMESAKQKKKDHHFSLKSGLFSTMVTFSRGSLLLTLDFFFKPQTFSGFKKTAF